MDPHTKAEFEKLLSKSANKTCIDCDTFNPQWASVNNGCFMCIKCAGNHRSMGVHITFVRSVTMDSWSKTQLTRMKYGGNAKLKRFWSSQKFPKNLTPKQKLNNTAMDKYREALLSVAKAFKKNKPIDNNIINNIPYIGYTERIDQLNKSFSNLSNASNSSSSLHSSNNTASNSNGNLRPKMQGFGNTQYDPNNNNNNDNDDTWKEFMAWGSSIAAKTTAVASDFAQKTKTVAVNVGSKASEKASAVKTKLGDEEYQANLKKNAADTWDKTTKTVTSWFSQVSTVVSQNINSFNEQNAQNEQTHLYNIDNNNNNNNNNQNPNRKKMPSLSSDQYFNKNSYGNVQANNINNNINPNKSDNIKQEDILGINNNNNNNGNINNLPPFPINKSAPETHRKESSDDFDDWGFDDDKPKKSEPIDITQAINGNVEGKTDKKNQVEDLLNLNDNNVKVNKKENDGNSSDDLDAFFDEMEKEDSKEVKNNNNNNNNNGDDMMDLLGSHEVNDKDKNNDDDWGWN